MRRLNELGLTDSIRELKQPVLGICLGMQLLFEASEEDDAVLLGLIPGALTRLKKEKGCGYRIWAGMQSLNNDPIP